ncbi:SapC family protein [Alkalimarinus alittae]|uniref:SapC family protein n=1 Tax=Alkalimarinus alittae TaxID=2961619 RepID=A0ABY6MZ69_9ALTE|nr:SapC family protein [Alkalimarinus alittae]UZE95136.1 SapC family protein [Alkalimarinus alittae]
MTNYVAIQRSLHRAAGFTPSSNYSFATSIATVPLLQAEIPNAIAQMPIAFQITPQGSSETFNLVGLQSLSPGKNAFLMPDGLWVGGYMPAFYRAYPFALLPNSEKQQLQLSIHSSAINDTPTEQDTRFFESDQSLTPRLQEISNFLAESMKNRQATLAMCKALNEANLIVPWDIHFNIAVENGQPQEKVLQGLYHIDLEALKNLPPEQLAELNSSGALGMAYGQLHSESRLKALTEIETAQQTLANQMAETNDQTEPDLDDLFGDKDDLFSFD